MNNTDYLKENVILFIDQNIPQNFRNNFICKGYKCESVQSIGYIGANDGKLLKVLRERKFILITYDKHFYKMAMKYNKFAVLIRRTEDNNVRGTSIIGIVIDNLHKDYKKVREYYNV